MGSTKVESIMPMKSSVATQPDAKNQSTFFSADGTVKHFDLKNLMGKSSLENLQKMIGGGNIDTTKSSALWELVNELGVNDPIWDQFCSLALDVTCVESGPFGAGSVKCRVFLSHDDFFSVYKIGADDALMLWKEFHISEFEILTQHRDSKEVSIEFAKKSWVFKTKGTLVLKFGTFKDFEEFVDNWHEGKEYYAAKK